MRREESKLIDEDIKLSNDIYHFLDENFYSGKNISSFERILDKGRQIKGIDVIFTHNGKTYISDEKAAVRYRNLKTYSLELSFINRRNEVQEGWFLNDKLETNSYVFVWIDDEDGKESVTVAVVMKEKIINHLKSLGWSKDYLKKKMEMIRNGESTYMGNIYKDGCKFSYSTQLVEQPINVILPREVYFKLADIVWKKEI